MEYNLPYYVEVKINNDNKLAQFRQELDAESCALYHIDNAANRLSLSALFVGEKSQQPGPLIRKIMESTYGSESHLTLSGVPIGMS